MQQRHLLQHARVARVRRLRAFERGAAGRVSRVNQGKARASDMRERRFGIEPQSASGVLLDQRAQLVSLARPVGFRAAVG
jgi:hypothetical protein